MSATKTQTRPAPLSEAQRQVLTAAAQRPEGAVILPARLKGKAAQTLAQALLDKALVREIRAKGELPVWRKDEDTGRSFTLVLTKAGRALVAEPVGDDPAHHELARAPCPSTGSRPGARTCPAPLGQQAAAGDRAARARSGHQRGRAHGCNRLAAAHHPGGADGPAQARLCADPGGRRRRVGVSHRTGARCGGLRRWLTRPIRGDPVGATPAAVDLGAGRGGDRPAGAARSPGPPGGVPQPHGPDRTGPHLQGPAVQGAGLSHPGRSVGRPPARHPPPARPHHRRFRREPGTKAAHARLPYRCAMSRSAARCWCANGRDGWSTSWCSTEGFAWNGSVLPQPLGRGARHHRHQVERPALLRPRSAG